MNIAKIIEIKDTEQKKLNSLISGIKNSWDSQDILNSFLDTLWLTSNEETRFLAYSRIVNFKGEPLLEYLEKQKLNNIAELEEKAYLWTKNYHFEIYERMLEKIQSENIISDFYFEVLKQTHLTGEAFCEFHIAWNHHLLHTINPHLEEKLWENPENIIFFLRENDLLDKWHGWLEADRSYSVVCEENWKYTVKTYSEAFPKETQWIIASLKNFQDALEKLEDPEYNRKKEYIDYLESIIQAFSETNRHELVKRWSIVDEKWMAIDTPFQIVHPIEYYEDKYRKAVSPEWDIRIDDTKTLDSTILADVKSMYEAHYDDLWRDTYKASYEFSLDSLNRTQLHICNTLLSYGSRMTNMYSAQVIPNDAIITAKCGKKIFALPAFILESHKNAPVMKLSYDFFDQEVLQNYKNCIFWDAQKYYKIYDIQTIGHEFGHTLWLDTDTEMLMNKKSWAFKDIEEFKATSWGLVSFFHHEDESLREDILTTHIMRCIGLIRYKKVTDVVPYYAESLIHLDMLFDTWIITYQNNKLSIDYSLETYNKYKELYLQTYKKLALTYLNQQDAGDHFLFDYAIKEWKSYNAKNPELKKILDTYYTMYQEIWNQIYAENLSQI